MFPKFLKKKNFKFPEKYFLGPQICKKKKEIYIEMLSGLQNFKTGRAV